MIPYKWPVLTAEPPLEKRLEIMQAIVALSGQIEADRLRQQQAGIAARLIEQVELTVHELWGRCEPRVRSYVLKYNPNQPRIPAGNPHGGEWTSEGDGSLSGNSDVVLAQNKVTPGGFTVEHLPGENPLDPQGLNKPISVDEQQKIADALTLIVNGDTSALQPHPYGNLPHQLTGAVLPESTAGYTAYDVLGLGAARGEGRLVIDNATGAIYYTNNHYYSFYSVQMRPRSD